MNKQPPGRPWREDAGELSPAPGGKGMRRTPHLSPALAPAHPAGAKHLSAGGEHR